MITIDAKLFNGEVRRLKRRFAVIEQTRINGTAKDQRHFKDRWDKRQANNAGSMWKKENDV